MRELALKYGFTYTGSCNCNGYYTEKFKLGDYQIRWRKKRHLGMVLHHGKSITGKWAVFSAIQEKLKEINELTQDFVPS